jgi:hypothetical protein
MTKKQAIKLARELRTQGKTVKVFKVQGVYTVPGKGIEAFSYYEVR